MKTNNCFSLVLLLLLLLLEVVFIIVVIIGIQSLVLIGLLLLAAVGGIERFVIIIVVVVILIFTIGRLLMSFECRHNQLDNLGKVRSELLFEKQISLVFTQLRSDSFPRE